MRIEFWDKCENLPLTGLLDSLLVETRNSSLTRHVDTPIHSPQQMQTDPNHGGKGFMETFWAIYRQNGIRGLYRGWGITVARAAPAHALIFATYEGTMKILDPTRMGADPDQSFARVESIHD